MVFSNNKAINKEEFKKKINLISGSQWDELVLKTELEEYHFVIIKVPFKVKGIANPIFIECRLAVIEKQYLVIKSYTILGDPQGIGSKRKKQIDQMVETFFFENICETANDENHSYLFYHGLVEETPVPNHQNSYWNFAAEHQRSYARLDFFNISEYYPLVHLRYQPDLATTLEVEFVNQEVIFYSNALYTNAPDYRELFWIDDAIHVKENFKLNSSDESNDYKHHPNPKGEFLILKETYQVFKKMYTYTLDQPLKLFPKKAQELSKGLKVSSHEKGITWYEFTQSNHYPTEANSLKGGEKSKWELIVLAQRLKEDCIAPLTVRDYVCITPDEIRPEYRRFGWVKEVINEKLGEYKIQLERDSGYYGDKVYSHSEIQKIDFPAQTYANQLVYLKETGFAVLKQEGYRVAQVEVCTRKYDFHKDEATLVRQIENYGNEDILLISDPSWLSEWETFLKIEDFQLTLDQFFETHPQWFFVKQWLVYCHLNFEMRVSLKHHELSFIFLLLKLMKTEGTESLVFDLILKTSVPSTFNNNHVSYCKSVRFIDYYVESTKDSSSFLAYSEQN